ncbi:MAG: hypothetical protein ACLUIW_02590 [Dysosmobacter welbionis]
MITDTGGAAMPDLPASPYRFRISAGRVSSVISLRCLRQRASLRHHPPFLLFLDCSFCAGSPVGGEFLFQQSMRVPRGSHLVKIGPGMPPGYPPAQVNIFLDLSAVLAQVAAMMRSTGVGWSRVQVGAATGGRRSDYGRTGRWARLQPGRGFRFLQNLCLVQAAKNLWRP